MSAKSNRDLNVPLMGGTGKGPANNGPRVRVEQKREQFYGKEGAQVTTTGDGTSDGATDGGEKEEKKKKLTYGERLELAGVSLDAARAIIDSVLLDDYYEEEVQLFEHSSFTVTLCTRLYGDTVRLMDVLEVEKPDISVHVNDIVARYNVAASLSRYGKKVLPQRNTESKADDEVMEARLNFLKTLPNAAVEKLMDRTAEFDRKIAVVFSEGAVEDF